MSNPPEIYGPANFNPALVTITRKRFSVTQGETLVKYNGQKIEQYGDAPVMQEDGTYRQQPFQFWIGVALREAIARGMVA